jgi:drug/metabolite transporter (DMT)-like permease
MSSLIRELREDKKSAILLFILLVLVTSMFVGWIIGNETMVMWSYVGGLIMVLPVGLYFGK